ncbi:DNA internalization-related competence protein ComEC/Rec2 [Paenibacillus sp. y28]|uniref:DNA internalization-related competence protein ComEC/Rec2 n=1 Tax=Paenibacillus sp. y28 TaxID=3129110 RepID=UPI00301B3E1B
MEKIQTGERRSLVPSVRRPVVAAAVLWVGGSAAAWRFPQPWMSWELALGCCLTMVLIAALEFRRASWLYMLLLFGTAMGMYGWNEARNVSDLSLLARSIPAIQAEGMLGFQGEIVSRAEVDGDRLSFTARVETVFVPKLEPASPSMEQTDGDEAGAWEEALPVRELIQVSVRLMTPEEQQLARQWQRGDRITWSAELREPGTATNYGAFDYRQYLKRNHIHWLAAAKGLDAFELQPPALWREAPWLRLLRLNDAVRIGLGNRLDELFGKQEGGFMKGLIIGLQDDLDPQQFQQFSQLGLTHILAISGLHVAVFVGGCMWIFRLAGLTRERNLTLCICLIPFYVLLSGGAPSVLRAGIMGMLALYAARRNLLKDGLNLVCLTGILMLLWEPYYLFDVGFQLSFLVTIGLIAGVPPVMGWLPVQRESVRSALAVTTVAQAVSFPLSVYYFNQFSLLSWFANLLLVPLISFVTLPLGSAALLLSYLFPWLARGIAWLTSRLNEATFWLVGMAANVNSLELVWPSPEIWWLAAYFVLLAALYWTFELWRERGLRLPFLAAGLAFALLLWHGYSPLRLDRTGTVQVLDVGQGDAILIRTPHNRHVLVDGGGTLSFSKPGDEWKTRSDPYEVGRKLLVPLLKQRGVHQIDYLLVTHLDQDHAGGLLAVLDQIPVKHLIFNGTLKSGSASEQLFAVALDKGIPLLAASEGDRLAVDAKTELTFLAPARAEEPGRITVENEQNEHSLVFLMKMLHKTFLFTGDIGVEEEQRILDRLEQAALSEKTEAAGNGRNAIRQVPAPDQAQPLAITAAAAAGEDEEKQQEQGGIDVLKVAHHGSKSSTSEAWAGYWRPQYAVISVGQFNAYGHPNDGVVSRLEEHGASILRTDSGGETQFIITEDGMRIRSKREDSD